MLKMACKINCLTFDYDSAGSFRRIRVYDDFYRILPTKIRSLSMADPSDGQVTFYEDFKYIIFKDIFEKLRKYMCSLKLLLFPGYIQRNRY